jgi:hypothetical protein
MMTIRYSTNWMGPVNTQWYKDRGLTKRVSRTLTEDNPLTGRKAGYTFEYDEITTEYACGRIDCRGEGLGQFGEELYLAPMLTKDWARFTKWLNTFETDAMWYIKDIIELYEIENPKITWAEGYE